MFIAQYHRARHSKPVQEVELQAEQTEHFSPGVGPKWRLTCGGVPASGMLAKKLRTWSTVISRRSSSSATTLPVFSSRASANSTRPRLSSPRPLNVWLSCTALTLASPAIARPTGLSAARTLLVLTAAALSGVGSRYRRTFSVEVRGKSPLSDSHHEAVATCWCWASRLLHQLTIIWRSFCRLLALAGTR